MNGMLMERVTGVEPVSSPWQGDIIAIIRYPLDIYVENVLSSVSWLNTTNDTRLLFRLKVLLQFYILVVVIYKSIIIYSQTFSFYKYKCLIQ